MIKALPEQLKMIVSEGAGRAKRTTSWPGGGYGQKQFYILNDVGAENIPACSVPLA